MAGAALAGLSAPATLAQRTLVIVTPRAVPPRLRRGARRDGNLVAWLGPAAGEAALAALPAGLRFSFGAADDAAAAAARLSARIDAHASARALHRGGLRGPAGRRARRARGRGAPPDRSRPLAAEDATAGSCDAAPRWRGGAPRSPGASSWSSPPSSGRRPTLSTGRRSREDFPLAVRMSPESQPVPATAHFRGEGTYNCPRRNYSVNLAGRSPRFVFPGFAQDKFHLVSMCRDRFYLRNLLVLTTLAAEGLFPVPFDLVELVDRRQGPGRSTCCWRTWPIRCACSSRGCGP